MSNETWGAIATWRMAHDGVKKASQILQSKGSAGDAVEELIKMVEAYPYYKSVGYGGLPNENGVVEMDAAFMDGDTLAQARSLAFTMCFMRYLWLEHSATSITTAFVSAKAPRNTPNSTVLKCGTC